MKIVFSLELPIEESCCLVRGGKYLALEKVENLLIFMKYLKEKYIVHFKTLVPGQLNSYSMLGFMYSVWILTSNLLKVCHVNMRCYKIIFLCLLPLIVLSVLCIILFRANSTKTAFHWKDTAHFNFTSVVDSNCREAYKLAGYLPVESDRELRNWNNLHIVSNFNILSQG